MAESSDVDTMQGILETLASRALLETLGSPVSLGTPALLETLVSLAPQVH